MRTGSLVARRLGAPCLLAGLCVIPHVALAQSRVAFAHERDVAMQAGGSVPTWSSGALAGVDFNRSKAPLVYATDREGRREEIRVDLPGAMTVSVLGAVHGSDGVMAVIGTAENADHAGYFLILNSPDRQRRTVIQLSPYRAQLVTIAGDGTIWTVGSQTAVSISSSRLTGERSNASMGRLVWASNRFLGLVLMRRTVSSLAGMRTIYSRFWHSTEAAAPGMWLLLQV